MSDHFWDDPDDDHPHSDLGALDYLSDTGTDADTDDSDPGASDLDLLATAGDQASSEDAGATDSYAAAIEVQATPTREELEEDAQRPVVFAVSSPARTVTAEASISGSIQRIKLTPAATSVPEAELARSILSTAKLANMKGRAVQRALIECVLRAEGLDDERVESIVEANASELPTPRQADDAVAEAEAAYLRGEH
ncbi:MAG: hypothetical protein P4L86_02595 [Mycobacterium sp.]|nr:hypothetical protein [Mycobacterium sp.]